MATGTWQLHEPNPARRPAQRRDHLRAKAAIPAVVEHATGVFTATLVDVSIYGCRLAASEAHGEGDRLLLRVDGGLPIAARVVWCDGERIGCRFDAPIERALMRELTLALN